MFNPAAHALDAAAAATERVTSVPITARSADGVGHIFPDGTDDAVIDRVMRDYAQKNVSGIQRMGDLLGAGSKQIEKGVGELGSDAPDEGVHRRGKPVGIRIRPGAGDIIGGVSTLVGSPAGLISPSIERAAGIPKEVTEAVAPALVPIGGYAAGRGLARALPETIAAKAPTIAELRAPSPLTGNVARRANEAAADKLAAIEDIKYRASLRHPGARDDFIQDEFRRILEDKTRRAQFSDDEVAQMERVVKGTPLGNASRWIADLVGSSALGHGVGKLAGLGISRASTARQVGKLEEGIARATPEAKSRPDVPNPTRAYLDRLFPPLAGVAGIDWRKGGGGSSDAPVGLGASGPENVVDLRKAISDRASKVESAGIDRPAMKQAILKLGGLPQKEIDQIIDHAVDAAKRYGSASAAAAATKLESPFWDKFYQAALAAMTEAK